MSVTASPAPPARTDLPRLRRPGPTRLYHLARQLADRTDLWRPHVRFAHESRWSVRVAVTSDYEAWLLTWLPGQGTHWHDHGGSGGAFVVLQGTLVDLIDLALVGKQLHWSIVGPQFRALHLQLDELVDSWRALSDDVAERAVAIGEFPDGQADAVAAGEELRKVQRGPIEDDAVVRELARRIAEAAERARARMDRLGALDGASQDVLTDVVRELEKQLWMVRAQLK